MQSKEHSILQSLAANSAFVAVVVIVLSELLALLRSMRLIPAKSEGAMSNISVEPIQGCHGGHTVQHYGTISRYQNRRGEKASRRKRMATALQNIDSQGRRERRAMRGRRASDFATVA